MEQLKIEYVPINSIKPYKRNAKLHPQEQIEEIKNSIKETNFNDPIGVWHGEIVEGHGRWEAAKQLGMTEIPIIRLDELSDEQRRAYALAHNKLTMNSEFDPVLLDAELAEIETIDMGLLGFEEPDPEPIETQEDNFETDLPTEAKAKLGDIYQLGEHRLMCGDSTSTDDVKCLLGGCRSTLLFTSPPYSDLREYEGNKDLSVDNLAKFLFVYKDYTDIMAVNLGLQFKDKEVYPYWDGYIDIAHECGLKLLAWNVWNKTEAGSIGMQKHMFPVIHEWIFVFGQNETEVNKTWEKKIPHDTRKTRARRQADGSIKVSTVGDTSHKYKSMESVLTVLCEKGVIRGKHPAVFPIKLPSEYIQALTDEEDIVIEPFCGSGTTLIACEQLNRKCYAMELEPKYIDVIIERWETLTGKKAVKLN